MARLKWETHGHATPYNKAKADRQLYARNNTIKRAALDKPKPTQVTIDPREVIKRLLSRKPA